MGFTIWEEGSEGAPSALPAAPARRRADISCSVDQTGLHRGGTEERRSARRKTERKKRKRIRVNRRARLRGRVGERRGSGGSRILNAAACLRAANRSCYFCAVAYGHGVWRR